MFEFLLFLGNVFSSEGSAFFFFKGFFVFLHEVFFFFFNVFHSLKVFMFLKNVFFFSGVLYLSSLFFGIVFLMFFFAFAPKGMCFCFFFGGSVLLQFASSRVVLRWRDLFLLDIFPQKFFVVFSSPLEGGFPSKVFCCLLREVRVLSDRRVVCATREDNTRCDNVNTWMTCANTLLLLIQTAFQECAVTSLVSMRSVSVCAVPRSVIHVVLRSQPYHNQRVWCLTFCRQRVLVQSRNLAGTTLPRNRLRVAKVTVYQHVGYADIRFLVLTIATYSSCDVTSQQTSSMFFPDLHIFSGSSSPEDFFLSERIFLRRFFFFFKVFFFSPEVFFFCRKIFFCKRFCFRGFVG